MAEKIKPVEKSKAEEILEVGQEFIQTVGYDGFSYRDIADRVGIKSASVHYYFPSKSDLALAVARQYRSDFSLALGKTGADKAQPLDQLISFTDIFQSTLKDLNRICLCGMLASEASSLPESITAETKGFFSEQQTWISQTISAGIKNGTILPNVEPDVFAQTFLSALEGAMIMARGMEQPEHLAGVASHLISMLRPAVATEK